MNLLFPLLLVGPKMDTSQIKINTKGGPDPGPSGIEISRGLSATEEPDSNEVEVVGQKLTELSVKRKNLSGAAKKRLKKERLLRTQESQGSPSPRTLPRTERRKDKGLLIPRAPFSRRRLTVI